MESSKIEILTLEDIMQMLGMSRKAVTHLLNRPGAPVLPRVKNAPFRVPKEPFIRWINSGNYQ